MITRTKDTSFLANSSKKFFHLGMGLSLLLVIGAFKLPVYSKAPVIEEPKFTDPEDIIFVTHFIPVTKELPPEEPKPKTKSPTVTPVTFEPVVNTEPVAEPVVEQAEPSAPVGKTQVVEPVKTPEPEKVETIVEIMPSFIGGEKAMYAYVAKNVYYSNQAMDMDLEGKVYVRFIVDKKGRITNVEIASGIHPLLDNAAIEVVKNMPNWNAGIQNGENVKVSLVLPINFVLK